MKKAVFAYWMFAFGIFILVLKSMGAYFFWNVKLGGMSLFVSVIGLIYIKTVRHVYKSNKIIWAFVFLLSYTIWDRDLLSQINLGNIISCVPFLYVMMMPKEDKRSLLEFCSSGLALISGISLIAFILLFFMDLPDAGVITDEAFEHGNYSYTNYVILLKGAFYDIRFNAIFREPGHLAMIASFFLFANRYDMKKWYNVVLLVVIGFTLSLAGYVLTFIGYLFYLQLNGNIAKVGRRIIVFLVFFVIAFVGIKNYNNGNNVVNELIILRTEYDEDKGIQGNNRFGGRTDAVFSKAIDDGSILVGVGRDERSRLARIGLATGAGYKMHLIDKGMIGTFLIFMFYYVLAKDSPYRRFAFFMLLLYCLSFLQRAYPVWAAWLIPFVTSIYLDDSPKRVTLKRRN